LCSFQDFPVISIGRPWHGADSLSPLRPSLLYGVPPAESPRRAPITQGCALKCRSTQLGSSVNSIGTRYGDRDSEMVQRDERFRVHSARRRRPDVFVHISAVERAGIRDLNEGQKIAYEIVADRRTGKSSADNLKPV
jgi:cold shock CspA family protein